MTEKGTELRLILYLEKLSSMTLKLCSMWQEPVYLEVKLSHLMAPRAPACGHLGDLGPVHLPTEAAHSTSHRLAS